MRRTQTIILTALIGLVIVPSVTVIERSPARAAVSVSAASPQSLHARTKPVPTRRPPSSRPIRTRATPTPALASKSPKASVPSLASKPSAITKTHAPRATRPAKRRVGATPKPAKRPHPAPIATGITRAGSQLLLNGQPYKFTGFNAYTAATWYGTNWGCGAPIYDLTGMFNALRPNSIVRFWAFQAQGWNNKDTPGHIDFTGIDRVVQAAEQTHQHLIMTLSDQAGNCDDGHWHDQAWYDGGYAAPRSDDDGRGLGDLSYKDWVTAIVSRYKNSPAIAFWEPVNEPQAADCSGATGAGCYDATNLTCPAGAALSLQHFFTAIGAQIRAIDPRALISEGVGGGGQCGLAGDDYATVAASPGIDLLTYHDYDGDGNYYPVGLQQRLAQAASVGKPLAVEEVGVDGGTGSNCPPQAQRASEVTNKIDHAFAGGAVGFLPWWYSEAPSSCGDDFGPGDPILAALRAAPSS